MFFLRVSLIVLLFCGTMSATPPPISIWTYGLIGNAPLYVRIKITIEKDERNRNACFTVQQVQNGTYYRNSCWEIDGEKHPRTTWITVKDLNAGRYLLQAGVFRNNEQWERSNVLELRVVGFGYESEPAL